MQLDLFDQQPLEVRKEAVSWTALSAMAPTSLAVNARLAENLATVLACVNAISSSIASLPANVFRIEGDERIKDSGHPLARLVRRGPNDWQTWPDFIEWLVASTLLRGNGLAEIVTDGAGRVAGLVPVPWDWVSVQMLPSRRLVYDINELNSVTGGTGRTRRLLQSEVLHLRDRSDDGLIGRSRLQRAAAPIQTAVETQQFAESMWRNGAHPSGAVHHDKQLSAEAKRNLGEAFKEAFIGPSNAAKVLILDQGLRWESISISPEDQELLASRRFGVEEIARIFAVPPPIIGDLQFGTFTNSETLTRWFAQTTLSQWAAKLEAEFARSVFSASHAIDFDMRGLMRGDPEQRWQAHKIAREADILTVDEIRKIEGFNPLARS